MGILLLVSSDAGLFWVSLIVGTISSIMLGVVLLARVSVKSYIPWELYRWINRHAQYHAINFALSIAGLSYSLV